MSLDGGEQRKTLKRDASGKFFYPIGIEMVEGENYRQAQAYEVAYITEDEYPHYQYTVVVSIEKVAALYKRLASVLPDWVSVIIEVPAPGEQGYSMADVWMSPPVPKTKMLEVFDRHIHLFCHDGMVGFGSMTPEDGGEELFLDDHKIIYCSVLEMGTVEPILESEGLKAQKKLRHFSDLSHVHYNLYRRGQGEDYLAVLEGLRKEIGLEWQDSKDYS
ncbi:MAG: hypothetical protein JW909_07080 [Planctomycetes bacterium]|nr:hypothetical protein [Planctomycetota bacterium]